MDPVPDLVTLHLWGVPDKRVPAALLRMARDRGPLRRIPGLRFAKLLGTGKTSTSNLVSIPYDFDHSGFVDAPYALPPEKIPVSNVRRRYYRGWCIHNSQALVAAAEMRTQRAAMLAVLDQIPQIEERTRRSAAAYLDGFFKDIATDRDVTAKLLKTCIN